MFFLLFNLNIMHGRNRKSALWPLAVDRDEIEQNLKNICECVHTYNPDFVALQEIDRTSILSGGINQFEFLNKRLRYPYRFFAPSCSIGSLFVSGNTLFSKYPLVNCESFQFAPAFPTDRMGFVIADATLPNGTLVSIASIHLVYLDWLRLDSRGQELLLVEKVTAARKGNIVLAGDFNCDLVGNEPSLRNFIEKLDLQAYRPLSNDSATYPSWNPIRRIDWILASKNLNFISYKTLHNKISDHFAILANLSA
ncbi:MAG: hypothetical protein A2942_00345 [Candidatus Lloydbacteria bacterium RIFCSPLOWO2_01_FULL_50_20]|uniref:Endonuclease/exonuclease/phosphatase domain-containing protein n=1 Tax=Candidatus Lloydbacteria bacterium RIFCSPLOWO2_01_FULL_50_20 TaxID=1798665 RepID=A0A1G2DCK5_9BACT|nr:MAG: hypothetical protein A3C13_02295 [Candidatus Lloydbacteria bacterium RIFCSPHIGHO2_02_FULL_50_11]OGZ11233.1 MAG: hypothetical protein A2942_00345 [Candidatus Lloydbacteria bacterium RIFCSPLOWO2_01_FULL_50_20]